MTIPPPSSILPLSQRNFLNVPETDPCAKSMDSMINLDGANLVFGTSFGYFDPFMIDLAKKCANVELRHTAALWDATEHAKNLGIHVGSLEDNNGEVVIDRADDDLDPFLGHMDYQLEGAVGSIT
jgi:hypothetical protein